ncbi:aquaporin NIP6-1-like [Populus alba x Populus x berolinensis]|nr:aquaporin NIP6-1-like [Populus alba x Populus x berolinensis]
MNAVRTLGPAGTYRDIWIYLVAPKLGALVAAATYTTKKLREEKAGPPRELPESGAFVLAEISL